MGFFGSNEHLRGIQNAKYEKDECGAALVEEGMGALTMDPLFSQRKAILQQLPVLLICTLVFTGLRDEFLLREGQHLKKVFR